MKTGVRLALPACLCICDCAWVPGSGQGGGCLALLGDMVHTVAEWRRVPVPDDRHPGDHATRMLRAYIQEWPTESASELTPDLRDRRYHARWLPSVLQVARANADLTPLLLQSCCVLPGLPSDPQAGPAPTGLHLPVLPSIALCLWRAALDGNGPLAELIPKGAAVVVADPGFFFF